MIVGLGGGSAMDTAKGCNFILTNGGRMQDYWGYGKAPKPMRPMIAIPTTAGTGSECQSFTLIADEDSHMKMACGDPKAMPRISILDPTLTITQPRIVTADTGIDALAHAVETAVTTKHNELSQMYSQQAFGLTLNNLAAVLDTPDDLAARGHMMVGAAFAGTAIETSMLGAAHSAANPLTAHYGVIHGQAVGVMLPAVVRFNAEDPAALVLYANLARNASLAGPRETDHEALDALVDAIEQLLVTAGIPTRLTQYGVKRDMIPTMAQEAAAQWTARFNPRKVAADDFVRLYSSVYALEN